MLLDVGNLTLLNGHYPEAKITSWYLPSRLNPLTLSGGALSDIGGSMHIVGHITPETEGVILLRSDGAKQSLPCKGYDHFSRT